MARAINVLTLNRVSLDTGGLGEPVGGQQGRCRQGRCSPLFGGLHAHGQRGHGGDRLGFFVLASLSLDQRTPCRGGCTLQAAPVLAWGGVRKVAQ